MMSNHYKGHFEDSHGRGVRETPQVHRRVRLLRSAFSIWIDADGTKWVHDGHERILTLKKMRMDGYTIPPLPASIIEAKDKTEAKKKLLANDSRRYGKIDSAGLTEFLNEEDSPIDEDELSDILELPEIDFETGEEEDEPSTHIAEPKEIECPACHEKFVPKK
jgi:hypothetical protein